jgi:hypothetical protein
LAARRLDGGDLVWATDDEGTDCTRMLEHNTADSDNPDWGTVNKFSSRIREGLHNEMFERFFTQRTLSKLYDEVMLYILFPDGNVGINHVPRKRGRVNRGWSGS